MTARRFGGPNGYGYLPPPDRAERFGFERPVVPARRCAVAPFGALALPSSIPAEVDLSPRGPAIMDQGAGHRGTSSCSGHRLASALFTAFAGTSAPLDWVPSPRGIYALGRMLDQSHFPGGAGQPLADAGCTSDAVQAAISTFGLRPMGAPVDGRYSDVSVENVAKKELLDELELDARTLVVAAHGLPGIDLCAETRLALAAGYPVLVDIYVDGPLEDWDPASGPLGAPDMNDTRGGWHAVYVCGYRIDAGRTIFKWTNSWGEGWGLGGFGEGSEEWLLAAEEHAALRAERQA